MSRRKGTVMPNPLRAPVSRKDIALLVQNENLNFDDEDRIQVLLSADSIDVQACPGSGKTTLIAAKLMLLAQNWIASNRGVCVLSHTNVAKNEIIGRLTESKTLVAQRLLTYPHFIGTIQEFVNRFLALPYLRSIGIDDIAVENEEYVRAARRLLGQGQFAWLRGKLSGLGSVENQDGFLRSTYRMFSADGIAGVNTSSCPSTWRQQNTFDRFNTDLLRLKFGLERRGYFLFRDMYSYAQIATSLNDTLSSCVATRFPYLFVDEMQDTQKFQDEILCKVFARDRSDSMVQRFGDPDQAIFHGIGNEEPNETFNGKGAQGMDFVIHGSHRFDNGIAEKIRGLSYNEIPLSSELNDAALLDRRQSCAPGEEFEHTIFTFDDDSREDIINEFAQAVSRQFEARHKRSRKFCAKAVGAVGNEVDPTIEHLKIGHYWPAYDKLKAQRIFKPRTLIEAVWYCRRNSLIDWGDNYKMLLACLLKLLRVAGKVDNDGRNFHLGSLHTFLESTSMWQDFRKLVCKILDDSVVINQESWTQTIEQLHGILQYEEISQEVTDYLAFTDEERPADVQEAGEKEVTGTLVPMPGNVVKHKDGFVIELSTIHGVKGETHDATLVMETKNYCYDLGVMIPYLTGECPNDTNPNSGMAESARNRRANKQFMRQFYVAMSRPKHLLCLAVHSTRLSAEEEKHLIRKGWSIKRLVNETQKVVGS
jgi:DNA helicase-2/ATP-dependent DNA helicase PcrA